MFTQYWGYMFGNPAAVNDGEEPVCTQPSSEMGESAKNNIECQTKPDDLPATKLASQYNGSVTLSLPIHAGRAVQYVAQCKMGITKRWDINDNLSLEYDGETSVHVTIKMNDGYVIAKIDYTADTFLHELMAGAEKIYAEFDELSSTSTSNDGTDDTEKRRKFSKLTKLRLAAGLPSDMMTPVERQLFEDIMGESFNTE